MGKVQLAMLAVLLASGSANAAPKDPNNICTILAQNKRLVYRSCESSALGTADAYRFSVYTSRIVICGQGETAAQKGFAVLAVWRRSSSAYGYAQATDEAWKDYKKDTGRRFVQRDDFADALDFIGWYNDRSHKRLKLRKNDAYRLYLAYYNGHTWAQEG